MCKRVYNHLAVKSNGDLVICSCDRGNYVLANLLEESDIIEAYNNDAFNDIREAEKTGVNYPTLCHTCPEAGLKARERGSVAVKKGGLF